MTARQAAAFALVAGLLAYVTLVVPRRTERLLAELRERIKVDPRARLAFYLEYLNVALVVVAVFAAVVWAGGLGAAAAGIAWPDGAPRRLLPAVAAGVALLGAVVGTAWLVMRRRDPEAFEYETQYARIEFVIPRRRKERDVWPVFCLAVAVVEELLYRGLFVLYAATLLGVSPWWLVAPTALVFGAGHRYQGWLGIVTTTGAGLLLGVVTAATGSLWPAIVLHWLYDLRIALLEPPPAPEGAASPAA
ncbi:MAG TPA: CPBP family intramembrane glutamic endopeptidase [Frankiaceae bacterium]|nr:CPBP family intramembrane glutamic endopeptidase [Frankiaceae bacterium]